MIKYVVGMLNSLYLSLLSVNADVNCRDLVSYSIEWEIFTVLLFERLVVLSKR
jgi:hypothetical protein